MTSYPLSNKEAALVVFRAAKRFELKRAEIARTNPDGMAKYVAENITTQVLYFAAELQLAFEEQRP